MTQPQDNEQPKLLSEQELDNELASLLGAYSVEERQAVKQLIQSQKLAAVNEAYEDWHGSTGL